MAYRTLLWVRYFQPDEFLLRTESGSEILITTDYAKLEEGGLCLTLRPVEQPHSGEAQSRTSSLIGQKS